MIVSTLLFLFRLFQSHFPHGRSSFQFCMYAVFILIDSFVVSRYMRNARRYNKYNTHEYWRNEKLFGRNLNELWLNQTIVVLNTITDMSLLSFENPVHQSLLRSLGIISSTTTRKKDMHFEVMRFAYSLLFQNSLSIQSLVDSWKPQFRKHRIGLQMRFGGTVANTPENIAYLYEKDANAFINGVFAYLSKHHISLNDTTLFVSTDSTYGLSLITSAFPNQVFVPPNHFIGHSSEISKHLRKEAYDNAIIDIALLRECEYLIITKGSSFSFTMSLQQKAWNVARVDKNMKNSTPSTIEPSMLL